MRSKGFTLVEILVVVVIIAIVISFAVLSINVTGRDTQLDDESRRIEGLLSLLHERALLEGRDFGLRVAPTSYEFLEYETRRDRWFAMDHESQFRHRDLPVGLSIQLQLDARTVVLKKVEKTFASDQPNPPQITVAASGEGTPFRLILQRDATQIKTSVTGDTLGKIARENTSRIADRSAGKKP